jgi:hypothetical protein
MKAVCRICDTEFDADRSTSTLCSDDCRREARTQRGRAKQRRESEAAPPALELYLVTWTFGGAAHHHLLEDAIAAIHTVEGLSLAGIEARWWTSRPQRVEWTELTVDWVTEGERRGLIGDQAGS